MTKLQISFILQIVINLLIIGMIILNDIDIRKLRADQMDNLNIMSATLDMYRKLNESQQRTNQAYDKLADICREEYETLIGQYKIIIDEYNLIQEQHKKLLECWNGVEKRYSDNYEQFMHVNKQLIELNPILKQIVKEGVIFRSDVDMARRAPIVGNQLAFNTGPEIPDPEPEPEEVKPKKTKKKKETNDEKVSAAERFA